MGAAIGSRNGARGLIFSDEIRRALAREDYKMLRRIVNAIAEKAANGDAACAAMLIDRMEGKASQSVEMHVDGTVELAVLAASALRMRLQAPQALQPIDIIEH